MSDVRRRHREMRAAVEDGAVQRAITLREQLRQQQWDIDELLEEFSAAVEAGAYDEAETVRHELRETLARRRRTDKTAVKRSVAARDNVSLSATERQDVRAHVESAISLNAARSAFLTTSLLYLSDPESVEDENVLEETRELEDREREFEERAAQAQPVTDDLDLPANLQIVAAGVDGGTMAPNEPTTLAVRLGNVGNVRAPEVTVTVTAPDDARVSPGERNIGDVAGGAESVEEFRVTAEAAGTYRFEINAEGAAGGAAQTRLSLTVDESGTDSPLLAAFSGDDGAVRFDDVIRAIAYFNDEEPIPGTDTAVEFQDVIWLIEEFNRD